MTSNWPWIFNSQKHSVHTTGKYIYLPLEAYMLACSTRRTAELQGCWNSEMHWMTSDWPWTFNRQKYPVQSMYLPHEA